MRIINFTASNVKRLTAVEITPDGNVVIITGANAQGKTSVLDAIWLALGGGQASKETARPVRDGEAEAMVELDLGELIVTRTWKGDKSQLVVKSRDGAKFSSPQTMLDDLVGRLSFDPLAFTRLSAKDQVAALLEVVDLGDVRLDVLAHEKQAAFDKRTYLGRDLKALGEIESPRKDAPTEEVSAADLVERLAMAHRIENARDISLGVIGRLTEQIAALSAELERHSSDLAAMPVPEDSMALEAELRTLEATNLRARENAAKAVNAARAAALNTEMAALTTQITRIDKARTDALAAATFPVEGMSFTDEGVTYAGIPFSQVSASEQIRVSLAMAMSLNPQLRVIRILDGSLLDENSMRLITEMADANDYQLWIERVNDDSPAAVVIEDGAVQDVWAP